MSPRTVARLGGRHEARARRAPEHETARRLTRREFRAGRRDLSGTDRSVAGADDHDRAGSGVRDLGRRRAEERRGEVAAPWLPTTSRSASAAGLDEHRRRACPRRPARRAWSRRRAPRAPGRSAIRSAAARSASSTSMLSVQAMGTSPESAGVVRQEAPGVDRDERRRPQRRLLGGPAERGGRMLGPVDPDHDPARHALILPHVVRRSAGGPQDPRSAADAHVKER